jgi:glutamine synthetase
MKGMLTRQELESQVRDGKIDTVLAVFPDLYGRLMGKRVSGRFFLEHVAENGVNACEYLLAVDMEMDPIPGYAFTSWEKGYGDFHCVPDFATLRRASWLDRTAVAICDLVDERHNEPIAVAPRSILRRAVEAVERAGYRVIIGSELEFFIFAESYESIAARNYEGLQTFGRYIEDYHTLQGTRAEPLVGAIRSHLEQSGIPVETSKGEWGPGQHEINLEYADALEMADRHVLYKQAAKEIAISQGLSLTFMAKWHEAHAGSSMHLHSSLRTLDDRSVFAGQGETLPGSELAAPQEFRWWLGGLLAHAAESTLLYAPYVNSYKRFRAGSFAPTTIAWSIDNRTVGYRVVGHGPSLRVENRIPGADANPYLAFAATICAGLDGLERQLEPPPMFKGDAYSACDLPAVPATLPEATAAFADSSFWKEHLGVDVVDHLVHFARTEQRKFEETVTTWERRRYLEQG